ncbi:MAG: hypothetical protein HRF45_10945 [Fimbriimonadia bacterium]|jgi:uncharacterized protein YicC (UPF0701 family)
MQLDWQVGLQWLALLGFGGVLGALVALVSVSARLRTHWNALREALTPYLEWRQEEGDETAGLLLQAVASVDTDMQAASKALRDLQERLRKR